jgi:hypothetical protein
MKEDYRGYEIEVTREESLGGWDNTYFNAYRISDGLEVICNFSEGEDTLEDWMGWMKDRVDQFIETKGASECMEEDY